jgi:enoyl-CoA hydratase/carnithine racemase
MVNEFSSPIATRVAPGEPGRVRFERAGHIAVFIIDGPTDLNPMSPEMNVEFFHHLEVFRDTPELWVGIVTAAGERAFSAGGDLKLAINWAEHFELEDHLRHFWYPAKRDPVLTPHVSMTLGDPQLASFKPVIGAINGHCLGAGFIRACAYTDIRLASETATFGLSEVKHGLGGGGGWAGIAQHVTKATAAYLCLTGDRIDAAEALRVGLINEIVPIGQLMDRALALAERLCERDPIELRVEKEMLVRDRDLRSGETRRLAEVFGLLTELSTVSDDE